MSANGATPRRAPGPLGRGIEVLLVAALYGAAGRLGMLAALPPGNVTPIWPSSGIALAAILLRGPGLWPGIWLGSLGVNTWVFLHNSDDPFLPALLTAACMGIGATLQALLGAALLGRHVPSMRPFHTAQGVIRFVVLCGVLGCVVSPTIGTTSMCLAGFDAWAHYARTWLTWWLGDIAGVLVVSPLLLTWSERPGIGGRRPRAVETAAFVALLLVASGVGFMTRHPLAFTVIPVLVWAAFRFRQHGSTAAIAVVSGFAIAGAVSGLGPFMLDGLALNESLLLLQAFIGVLVLTTLVMAGLITEREEASLELMRYRDQLEQRVAERTRQLEAANRELEAFGQAVSHDLRTPLTIIQGSVETLLEGQREALDERGREYLEQIESACRRMADLIQDLLDLSFVERCKPNRGRVDVSALAREVQAGLESRDTKRRVEFRIQEGMCADADERLLRIALENLLGNAWKFTGKRPQATIELGVRDGVFFVRDNGAGFDMTGAEELFRPFHRLHSAGEFPGTGVGLSTVKRVVEHHGGQIWAEAEAGRGATFYFTL